MSPVTATATATPSASDTNTNGVFEKIVAMLTTLTSAHLHQISLRNVYFMKIYTQGHKYK